MSDSLSDLVRCAVAQQLNVDWVEIRSTHRFQRDLGLEPLDIVLVALRLEEIENVELPIEKLDGIDTVADLTALVRGVIANDNHVDDESRAIPRARRWRGMTPTLRRVRGG